MTALRFPEYKDQLQQARSFLKANDAHPAVEAAIAFFTGTFDRARRRDASLAALKEWSWLASNGADVWEALAISLALFLKARQDPQRFPFGPSVAHTIGGHLCRRLVGRPKVYRYEAGIEVSRVKSVKAADAAAVGGLVFSTLLPFFLNVDVALKEAEAAALDVRGSLTQPFDPEKLIPMQLEARRSEERKARKRAEKEARRLEEGRKAVAELGSNAALRGFKRL